jgi:hypothetical protein
MEEGCSIVIGMIFINFGRNELLKKKIQKQGIELKKIVTCLTNRKVGIKNMQYVQHEL